MYHICIYDLAFPGDIERKCECGLSHCIIIAEDYHYDHYTTHLKLIIIWSAAQLETTIAFIDTKNKI